MSHTTTRLVFRDRCHPDKLPAEVLPVWPERGELEVLEAARFGALLEALSQAQRSGQRVLTAEGWLRRYPRHECQGVGRLWLFRRGQQALFPQDSGR